MKLKIFAVYDHKANVFGIPFFKTNEALAKRDFGDAVQDAQTTLYKHPEDYQLFEIGDYDDADASLLGISPAKLIATASEFKKAEIIDMGKLMEISKNHKEEIVEVR